jgi:hypothetical protein
VQYLYCKFIGDDIVIVTIHVDDGLIVSSCSIFIDHFFEELSHHVKSIKILKEFTRFPGMELDWQESGAVHLYQTHYISEEC